MDSFKRRSFFFFFFGRSYLRIFYFLLRYPSTPQYTSYPRCIDLTAGDTFKIKTLHKYARFYQNTALRLRLNEGWVHFSDVRVVGSLFQIKDERKFQTMNMNFGFLPSLIINHLMTPSDLSRDPPEGLEPHVGNLWNKPN